MWRSSAVVDSTSCDQELRKNQKRNRIHGKCKKGRIIIRNLSFKATEKTLSDVFSKYGTITEINIPKKKDGKMRGFVFLEYENTKSAILAINNLNGKDILGRPVAIDFAFSKDRFEASKVMSSEEPEQIANNEENEVAKLTEHEHSDMSKMKMKKRKVHDEHSDMSKMKMKKRKVHDSSDSESGSEDESHKSSKNSEDEEQFEEMDEARENEVKKNSRTHPNDVNEGRTVFLRNLSYDTATENLKQAMSQFGTVKYCLLCVDKVTEHPKGTAFVQFDKKEEAENCIQHADDSSTDGLWLDGRKLIVTLALSKSEIQKKLQDGQKKHKDNRNLYLLSEGLIRPGSDAAKGVSQPDLMQRLRLEALKRKRLKNYHNFISTTRLCVHNLPPGLDDKKFRKIFLQAADPKACITEAKVMRNRNSVDSRGEGRSKGFGFINFTTHEHALHALRHLNNNPNVFTPQKRPIVEFSVENMTALRVKKNRLERQKGKIQKGHSEIPDANPLRNLQQEALKKKNSETNYSKARRKNKNFKVCGGNSTISSGKRNTVKKTKGVMNFKSSEGNSNSDKKKTKGDKGLKNRKLQKLKDKNFTNLVHKYQQILHSGEGK